MPRKQRKDKRRDFSVMQREQLQTGHDYEGGGFGDPFAGHPILDPDGSVWSEGFPGPTWQEAEARAAWTAHRAELEQYWLQDPEEWAKTHQTLFGSPRPGGPGTRPWAWWVFSAPEPRQMIAIDPTSRSFKSIPGIWERQVGAQYESETVYLERHNLLTEDEIAEIEKANKQMVV